jgi:hypothetical protein
MLELSVMLDVDPHTLGLGITVVFGMREAAMPSVVVTPNHDDMARRSAMYHAMMLADAHAQLNVLRRSGDGSGESQRGGGQSESQSKFFHQSLLKNNG